MILTELLAETCRAPSALFRDTSTYLCANDLLPWIEMMNEFEPITGGCLCGAVRYQAITEPDYAGLCYCTDCRKASGSGFIPFMGFSADSITMMGETRQSQVPSFRGGIATRNHCARCGSLVFGGVVGQSDSFTIYAGSLDEPSRFHPKTALFVRDRPAWAAVRPDLKEYQTMPG